MGKYHPFLKMFEYTKVFYKRIQKGRNIGVMPGEAYIVDVYAFFMFCYHIKDWIKNDCGFKKEIRNNVEYFINKNECMRICADLCNGLKHMQDCKKRSGKDLRIGHKTSFEFSLENSEKPLKCLYFAIDLGEGREKDVLELASECINAWEEFFKKYNIATLSP